jgi:hypothetical protein
LLPQSEATRFVCTVPVSIDLEVVERRRRIQSLSHLDPFPPKAIAKWDFLRALVKENLTEELENTPTSRFVLNTNLEAINAFICIYNFCEVFRTLHHILLIYTQGSRNYRVRQGNLTYKLQIIKMVVVSFCGTYTLYSF